MATLSRERLQSAARKEASWVVGAGRQFFADRCPSLAASIAFYSAFSLAPTLVMVIAVAGWFFGAEAARGELFRQVHNVLGNDAAAGITTIVQNAHRAGNAGGIAAMISLSMLAIGASATFSSLNSALNIVWPPARPRFSTVFALVRVRLISFSLVLGVAFLLIVSLVLDTAITFIGQWLWGNSPYVIIGNLLQLAVGLVVLAAAFAALLKFLPDAEVRWGDALVGGIVAAVLFSAGKKLFALYLAHAGMASAFGAAGSLAVLLMWLYFSAAVLLLGAEFAAARGRLHDPRGAWGFLQETPPGSRAKLASVLAASTIAPHSPAAATAAAKTDAPGAATRAGMSRAARAAEPAATRAATPVVAPVDDVPGTMMAPTDAHAAAPTTPPADAPATVTTGCAGHTAVPTAVPIGNEAARVDPLAAATASPIGNKSASSETPLRSIGLARADGGVFGRRHGATVSVRRSVVRLEEGATYAAALTLVKAGRTMAAVDRYVRRHPWRVVLLTAGAALTMAAASGRRHDIADADEPAPPDSGPNTTPH